MKIRNFLTYIFLTALFFGCTKDDVCDPSTATTPLLYIEFKDINNRLESKAVENLRISVSGDTTAVRENINDTIAFVPLNTLATRSEFIFTFQNTDTVARNIDTLSFNYTTQDQYINRACAFKSTFSQLSTDLVNETANGNWIRDISILQTEIENENEAHLTIFH